MKRVTKLILTAIVTFMLVEIFPVNKISADTVYEAELIVNTASGPVSTSYETIEAAFNEANRKIDNKAVNKDCIVKLLKDCAIEEQLEVERGSHFTLDLNGFTIDAQKKDRLIYIYGFTAVREDEEEYIGHLKITDSSPNHTGALINGYRASGQLGGAGIEVLGQLHFMGGTIRNCRNEGYMDGQGAAIYVEGQSLASLPGYVLMDGNAKIENCYAEAEGGAIYLEEAAHFRMDGGTITNCHAEIAGGAIFAFKNSNVEIYGGSINNCNVNPKYDNGGAYDGCGGGIFAFSGSIIDMKGGEIKYCTAKNGGGIYLKQGFKDIDDKYFYGSQGYLYGGTISNNRAENNGHGGGVYVQAGYYSVLAPTQIARLHLSGGIVIDNNQGKELRDGPIKDNVYLELKMGSGTDGYHPYFYVDDNLTGIVGINADDNYFGQISFEQKVAGSQLRHLFSDDNGKAIEYREDNINYLVKGHATILDAHLVTWDSDRTSATVEIDNGSHSIRIYAARHKDDLDTVFDPERVELIWRGGRLKDEGSGGQTYYESPLTLTVFGPANREYQRCYYQRVTVFDSREVGQSSYSETWDIRIYFLNTTGKVKFAAKDTEVFERHYEYSSPVWKKIEPTKKDEVGRDIYYVPLNDRLKVVPVNKEGYVFTNWSGNTKFKYCVEKTSEQKLTDPTIEFTVIKAYAFVCAKYEEKPYTVNVVNGYLNEDITKTSLTTKAGETVSAHFKAPEGVDPNYIRFVKWETSGTFKLDESIVNNENISFVMPKESFTLTGIYETKKQYHITYHTMVDNIEKSSLEVREDAYESKQITKIVAPKIEDSDGSIKDFDQFKKGASSSSDVLLTTTKLDDGNYQCSFVMPNHDVDIYIYYKDNTPKYKITYYRVFNGNVQGESSEFPPFTKESPAGAQIYEPFRSYIISKDGTKRDLDKFTTDSPDVVVTTTIPVENTHACSFTMPAHDVNIYINYYSSKYELAQVNTTEPGMALLDSGSTKTITAATAPEGMVFDQYELSSNGVVITDRYTIREIVKNEGSDRLKQDPITIVMPSYNLTVTAKYKKIDYVLSQINTSEHGESIHNEGDVVVIKYIDKPRYIFAGYKYHYFNKETGEKGAEITNPEVTLKREILDADGKIIKITMPNASIEIEADYDLLPPTYYKLTQIGTQDEGISQHIEDYSIYILAQSGKKFNEFVFYDGLRLVDKNDLNIKTIQDGWIELRMPNYDLTVIALYDDYPTIKYTLTQIDTVDAGIKYYASGTKDISIDAINNIGTDITYEFTHFDFYKDNQKLEDAALDTFISKYVSGDVNNGHIKITMPNYNLAVKANYDSDPSIDQYPLTQINTYNEGTANYKQNTEGIHIKALDIDGFEFKGWKFSSYGEEITSGKGLEEFLNVYVKFTEGTNNKEFDLTMPGFELTVEALFYDSPLPAKHKLVEENTIHSGTFNYYAGTKVDIKALTLMGKEFDKWKFYKFDDSEWKEWVLTPDDVTSYIISYSDLTKDDHFTLKMPNFDLKVEATFRDIADKNYTLVQEKTIQEGESQHYAGTKISIRALEIPGYSFDKWKFYDGTKDNPIEIKDIKKYVVDDLSNDHFTLIMPRISKLIVEATFKEDPMIVHYLKQINTNDEGTKYHSEGQKINIRALMFDGADSPEFQGWEFYDKDEKPITKEEMTPYISGDLSNNHFVLTMPNFDLIVKATYDNYPEIYDLEQINTRDTGIKSLYAGTQIAISAISNSNFPLIGWKFYDDNGLEIPSSNLKTNPESLIISDKPVSSFVLTMPSHDLTVEAIYETEPPTTMYTLSQIKTVDEGAKNYHAGTTVRIRALDIKGYNFSGWKFYKDGEELSDTTNPTLTDFKASYIYTINEGEFRLTMPAYDLTVEALYTSSSSPFKLITKNTTYDGSRNYYSGTKVDVEALNLTGFTFDKWKFYNVSGSDKGDEIVDESFINKYVSGGVTSSKIVLTMPNQDLYVEATYKQDLPTIKYDLTQIKTVNPGTTSHFSGTKINIEASELMYGTFDHWEFKKGSDPISSGEMSAYIDGDLNNPYFTLTMPAFNLTITAVYSGQLDEKHKLTTINASPAGENMFYADTEIEVKADTISGKIFDHFKVEKKDKDDLEYIELTGTDLINFINTNVVSKGFDSGNFILKMPNYDLRIESIYREPVTNYYKLIQVKTVNEGTSEHIEGAHISIQAQKISGSYFKGWKFYKTDGSEILRDDIKNNIIGDITSDRFTLIMPKYDIKVEATFVPNPEIIPHSLRQINTVDEGVRCYYAGSKVKIVANNYGVSPNPTFVGWKFYKGTDELKDEDLTNFIKAYINPSGSLTESSFVLTMPNYDLTVEATYSKSPVAVPHKLTLVGTYNDGESYLYKNDTFVARRISDSDLPASVTFIGWKIYKGDQELTESTTPKLSEFIESQVVDKVLKDYNLIVMPDYDLKVEAVYKKGTDPTILYKLEQVYTVDEGNSMHQANDAITITAITPPSDSGYINDGFKYYKNIDGIYSEIPEVEKTFITESTSSVVTIAMPNYDLKVVAQFKQAKQKYELTSISTSLNPEGQDVISFMKKAGDLIEAMPKGTGAFEEWLIVDSNTLEKFEPADKEEDPSHKLKFTMPAKNITIMPVYDDDFDDVYWIDVINGYANGEPYDVNYKGTDIIVEASEYDGGQFTNWKVYKYKEVEIPVTRSFLLSASPETETDIVTEDISNNMAELSKLGITNKNELYEEVLYINQPDFDIELEAKYATGKVQLEVINGTKKYGPPSEEGYNIGSEETIVANPCPSGMRFSHWRVIEGNPIWYENGQYCETATLKLVDDVKVEAIYILKPPYVIPPTGVK